MLLEAIGAAKGVYGSLLGGPWGMRLSEKLCVGQRYQRLRVLKGINGGLASMASDFLKSASGGVLGADDLSKRPKVTQMAPT